MAEQAKQLDDFEGPRSYAEKKILTAHRLA